MIDEVLISNQLTLDYLVRLVSDVPDDCLALQPHGAVNHPAWILGHLTYSCQAIGGELGLNEWLPAIWRQKFGTGSMPVSDRSQYPVKEALIAELQDGTARLAARLKAMGEAAMSLPLPDERHRSIFPTIGHATTHILTAHAAVHVGQASVWRRLAGYSALASAFV